MNSWINDCLCIDTETTGLNFRKPYEKETGEPFAVGARAFALSATDVKDGRQWFWEWPVDPFTRNVKYDEQDLFEIRTLIERYQYWVFHNSKHDLRAMLYADIIREIDWERVHDTHPCSHVLNTRDYPFALKDQGIRYLDMLNDDEQILKNRVRQLRREITNHQKKQGPLNSLLNIPIAPDPDADYWLPKWFDRKDTSVKTYCMNDTLRGALLWKMQVKQLLNPTNKDSFGNLPLHHYNRERALLRETYETEEAGLHIRPGAFARAKNLYRNNMEEQKTKLLRIAAQFGQPDINLNSHPQKVSLLYRKLGLPILVETDKGSPSCSGTALEELGYWIQNHPKYKHAKVADAFLSALGIYTSNETALDYCTQYDEHKVEDTYSGRNYLYTSLNQSGTATTRYSSSDPNLMNVGGKEVDVDDDEKPAGKIRDVFGPPPGKEWWSYDYNQLELRLLAKASGDAMLTRILQDGIDRHQVTCDTINKMRATFDLPPIPRKIAKNINFAWGYGAGLPKLSMMSGIPADAFDAAMREAYPDVVAFMDDCILFARRHGYIETMFGYRLYVPRDEPYKATNYRIQGTAGELAKNAMIDCNGYIRKSRIDRQIKLILQVHDELDFQSIIGFDRDHLLQLQLLMQATGDAIGCPTPVEASHIKISWGKPRKVKLTV